MLPCNGSEPYHFEQGPIRPPSEADSLLLRVTRNCPWNKCSFCSVYKGSRFSIRDVESVKADIDAVNYHFNKIKCIANNSGQILRRDLIELQSSLNVDNKQAFHAALNWYVGGAHSIFLQDANSLIIKPNKLINILKYIQNIFPWVERITSYGRSHTIYRMTDDDLLALRLAGLNRIHIGLESGSDKVLYMVRKGCDKDVHVRAGNAVKNAGIQLSEYFMPGLGGKDFSREHALETADALNQINPEFIRLRTLFISKKSRLFDAYESGDFQKCSGLEIAEEIKLFLQKLKGIKSMVISDHMLNLFEDVSGKLPEDKEKMIGVIDRFLELTTQDQCLYQVGKRMGTFRFLSDMEDKIRYDRVFEFCQNHSINSNNLDSKLPKLMMDLI